MNVEPHVHREHVDSFFVLEGTFPFNRSGEEVPLEPGDLALAPPLLVHGFRPGGRRPQRPRAGPVLGEDEDRAQGGAASRPRSTTRTTRRPTAGFPAPDAIVRPAGEGELLEDERRRVLGPRRASRALRLPVRRRSGLRRARAPTSTGSTSTASTSSRGSSSSGLDGKFRRAGRDWVAATPSRPHVPQRGRRARAVLNIHAPGLGFDEYLRRQAAGEDGRRFHESFDVYEVEVS